MRQYDLTNLNRPARRSISPHLLIATGEPPKFPKNLTEFARHPAAR
jgi:hypothetical protein